MRKILNDKTKKELINFTIIFIISLIVFAPWLKPHYTVDNYTIMNYGYRYYSEKWSLIGGRAIMYLILNLANFIKLPVDSFIVLSEIFAILISSINVRILKTIIEKLKKENTIKDKIIINIIAYITIFNFMFIDCMMYVECTVMALSIMCYLIASKILIEKEKKYLIKSSCIVLLGVFCYQGTICMFFAFTALFSIIKNKSNFRKIIIDIIECGIISFFTILTNLLFVKIITKKLEYEQKRISDIKEIIDNLDYLKNGFLRILIDTCGIFPKYLFICILIAITAITIIYTYRNKNKKIFWTNYIILTSVSILSSYAFFIMTKSSFFAGRMRVSIGALIGLIFIYIYLNGFFDNKTFKSIIYTILVAYTTITISAYEFIMYQQIKVNYLEKQDVQQIEEYIEDYENKNNVKIKYVIEVVNVKQFNKAFYEELEISMTSAVRSCEISTSVINVYTNRDLIYLGAIHLNDKKFSNIFYEKGYECEKEILFVEINIS